MNNLCPLINPKTNRPYDKTWSELIVIATMSLAIKGNATALREVWERSDGKVLQPTSVSASFDAATNAQSGREKLLEMLKEMAERKSESPHAAAR
jgi:hypothetical protein